MSYKSIINIIKGVVKNPDLDSLIKKEIPKIKKYATKKHEAIMTAVENNIITEEIGKTQMNNIYGEIDDKICAMIENTDKMIEFLENIKEHHEEMNLDEDVVKKYVFAETLKYQRLSAEVIALSFYVDTLFEEFGLLDDMDGIDEEFDDDLDDDETEEDESEDSEDDEEPEVYESEITFRDKLFGATDVEVVESTLEDGIDLHISYETSGYTGTFALRCMKDRHFEYGYIAMAPKMIRPVYSWSSANMQGFIGIMKTKCPNNPFLKWYTSEDGYQKYVKEWEATADESGLTFKDKLFAATSYELDDERFENGVDLCINFDDPLSGDTSCIALRCCFEDESFAYGYVASSPFMINVVDSWSKSDMDALISEMKDKCPNNPVLGWFTRSDGYDKYRIEWMRTLASAKHNK